MHPANPSRRQRARRAARAAAIAAVATLAACAAHTEPVALTANDFKGPLPTPADAQTRTRPTLPPVAAKPADQRPDADPNAHAAATLVIGAPTPAPQAPAAPTTNAAPPTAPPNAPARADTGAANTDDAFVVDEMVGQINGVPVYADAFFADMDARLRAESARLELRQFIPRVQQDISEKLRDIVRDQLLLAEFRASLTAQEKQGVLAFIENARENLISQLGGTAKSANQRLLTTEGLTLDEKVRLRTDEQFVRHQLDQEIDARINVSFNDIRAYYDNNQDLFNPPPVATLRIIRVPSADTDALDAVQADLDAGIGFDQTAANYSSWAADDANTRTVTLETGSVAETTFWSVGELDDATRSLQVGQRTQRIDAGSSAWWVKLERVESPDAQSLYDAQAAIEAALTDQLKEQERRRYFNTLLARSNVSDFPTMVRRLTRYAAERYYLQPLLTEADPAGNTPAAQE